MKYDHLSLLPKLGFRPVGKRMTYETRLITPGLQMLQQQAMPTQRVSLRKRTALANTRLTAILFTLKAQQIKTFGHPRKHFPLQNKQSLIRITL